MYFDTFPRKEDPVRSPGWEPLAARLPRAAGVVPAPGCLRCAGLPRLLPPARARCRLTASPAHLPACCPTRPTPRQVREAAYNIQAFKRLWARAARLAAAGLDRFAGSHDAMGLLEFLAADDEASEAARQAAVAAAA